MDLLKNLAGRAVERVAALSEHEHAKFIAKLLEDPVAASVLTLNQMATPPSDPGGHQSAATPPPPPPASLRGAQKQASAFLAFLRRFAKGAKPAAIRRVGPALLAVGFPGAPFDIDPRWQP